MLALNIGNAWAETESLACPKGTISNNTMTWELNSCTIVHAKGTNSNYAEYAPWRVYQGAIVTFTPKANISISKIVITAGSSAYATAGATTWTNATATASNSTITVTPTDQTKAFSITASAQTRWSNIEITYTSAGSEPPTPPTTYTIKWHTAVGTTTDVTLNEGATITKPVNDPTMTGYAFMGWTDQCNVATDGAGFTAISNFGTADSDKDFYAVFAKATITDEGGAATEVTDVLNRETTGVTSSSYETWSKKTATSTAIYAGQSAGSYSSIQLRSNNNNSGIVTTASGGKVKKVVVVWESENTANGRTLDIYGKSTAYSEASDLYDTFKKGTKIGSIVKGTSTELTISGDYEYIGFRSNSGALYLTSVSITWASEGTGTGTTTYSDYITTCASGIEYVELGDDFKWSATEAEVTIDATDNVFPTLTNTHNVPVKYSSSDDAIATIADGTVTLKKEGSVTITAKYEGGTSASTGKEYKAKTVTYSLKVNKAAPVASGITYVKVTSTAGITNGEYLIVYEDASNATPAPVAFDGSLEALDAVGNTLEVTINNNTIAGTNYIDAATFTIDVTNGTILSASGKYIGKTANSNGLDVKTTAMTNTFVIDANGNAIITGNTAALRYNKTADQKRFRYYKDGGGSQEKITLYKKASKHTVTLADCTNGSVSAKMGETALATDDQVLSGIQITLNNTPATGYKLSAYDVYKTDDNTTKVTLTDGKFIMPEHDVTISATFELAKTLTGIDIKNDATQTTFWQGETFNSTGLKVTAHFDGAEDEDVTDKVTVTGSTATAGTQTVTVSYKEGEVTKDATYTITIKAIPNTKETAYTVADAFDIIDKLGDTDKMYITGFVSQADLVQSTIDQYKNADYWISADGSTNGQQLEAYRGKYLDNADFTSVNQIMVGDEVIIYGKLTKYGSTYEFAAGNYLVSLKRDKQQPELSYTTTEYNVNLGDAFTAPTLNNPHTLAVTYSSNNEDVATVATDGAVTIKAAGTVVITASFAGNDDYVAGEASYTINITDPSISEATFVAGTDKSEELSISKNGVTVEFTGGTFSRDDNYRCYANQSMTISYNDGQITKIVLAKSSDNSKTPSNFTTEQGTYAYAGSEGVWTGEAKSVTFETTTQVQMNTITVYYKQDTRTAAGLEWSPEAINLTIGDAFTAPTFSNPNSLNVNFESNNTTLATVSNTGVISLNAGVTGTAVITASYEGDATYKDAAVTCTITVNPKTETVVILAQYNGQWYALKNVEETAGKVLAALPVNYVGGKLYNVEEADKATIEWQRVAVTDGIIFKNGENYIYGTAGSTDLKLSTTECAWSLVGTTYMLGDRTFLYRAQANGFKNYNAEDNAGTDDYSDLPVVTAPVYGTGTITPMVNLTPQMYGTICLENNVVGYEGITFYKVAGKEDNKVIFDEVTELVAGMPYIYIADSKTATIVKGNEITAEAGYHNSLQGTFTQIDPAESNILTDNYILYNNVIKMCGKNCGLKDHKAYFIASELDHLSAPPAKMPGRRRVSLNTTGENAATGIGDVVVPTEQATKVIINGQLIIIRNGEKFNVQGQRL